MARAGRPWRWTTEDGYPFRNRVVVHLTDGRKRERATIWQNEIDRFTWHTFDDRGTGGENSECTSLNDAKDQCVAAIVRQGWAPGGWKVTWSS